MWTLLNPLFLAGAAFAVVPLVLHLLRRQRAVRMPFSTVRFLRMAQRSSARQVRMENFLLWLLRTLLVLLLTLAFTGPVIRTTKLGGFFGAARRDVAIVWDVSYSMAYERGSESVWTRSLETVREIISGLEGNDKVCIYLAEDTVSPLVEQLSPDLDLATSQVDAQACGTTSSRLLPALLTALEALAASENEREVHVVTDGQSLPWIGFDAEDKKDATQADNAPAKPDASIWTWDASAIDRRIAFFVTMLGPTSPENTTPYRVELEPPLIMSNTTAQLTAGVQHSGDPGNGSIAFLIDGEEVGRQALTLEAGVPQRARFVVPALAPGMHAARLQTDHDALSVDNQLHLLIRVREQLPTLCVGTEDDTLFLMTALNPGGDASDVDVTRMTPAELGAHPLKDYSCVFLCNALPLPGDALLQVENFVHDGGLLVLFPGDRAAPADYGHWRILPALPIGVREPLEDDVRRILQFSKLDDALLSTMRIAPGSVPSLTVDRYLSWDRLAEGTDVILSIGSAEPLLLGRRVGRGKVLMYAVSADRRWSNFPLSPFFLPLVHQAVRVGAGIANEELFVSTSRELPITQHAPQLDEDSVLIGPSDQTITLRTIRGDNRLTVIAENLMEPGIYTSVIGAEPTPVLAVNMPREESNLTRIDPLDARRLLGVKICLVAESKADLLKHIEDHRIGRSLVEPLLWLVLLLCILEIFLSNRKSRPRENLSDELAIDAAGNVRGFADRSSPST
jgi:hypothetical protein